MCPADKYSFRRQWSCELICRGAKPKFRRLLRRKSDQAFRQKLFAQVLWQFAPRSARRRFQVFLWRQILNQILFLLLKFLLVYLALGVSFLQNLKRGFFVIMSATRLTREPFDKRDDTGDYQDPPENHKNPTEPAHSSKSKVHHIVC